MVFSKEKHSFNGLWAPGIQTPQASMQVYRHYMHSCTNDIIYMIDPPAASSFSLLTGNLRFVWRPPFRQLARWLFVEHHIKEKLQEVEDNDGAKPADHPGGVGSGAQTAAATGANHHEVWLTPLLPHLFHSWQEIWGLRGGRHFGSWPDGSS